MSSATEFPASPSAASCPFMSGDSGHSGAQQAPSAQAPSAGAPPADVAIFFDPLSFAAYDNPYELYKNLRDNAPVYFSERRNLYVISRHEDVHAALKNDAQLVNSLGNDMDGTHDSYGLGNLVAQDPPRHTVLRAAVRRVFAAREILAKEDGLREMCEQLLADMHANGSGDFAAEFALPFALSAATSLVGVPAKDIPLLQGHLWRSMQRTVGAFGLPDDAATSNHEAEEHLAAVFKRRLTAVNSGADTTDSEAITQIILSQQKGKVEENEQVGLAHLVISAAIDAPAALVTNIVAILDKFPHLQGYLKRNPSMIPAFVEEALRYDTPGQNLCRQSTTEITIAGVTIPADSRIMLLQGSANRDERVFENPDSFDITREFTPQKRIMSFGDGIHACMGSPLARLAARIFVETLVAGPEIRIVGMPERWVKQMVRGFSKLPVQFIN